MEPTKFKMRNPQGNNIEVPLSVEDYKAAGEMGLSLTQYLSRKFGDQTDEAKYGSVIGQFMASAGLFVGEDYATGLKSPTMKAVVEGGIELSAITRDDGEGRHTPSGRLLFPEIIMRTIESELRTSHDDFLSGWESMIAQTSSVNGQKFDQPIINVKAPEDQASNPIAQLAEPDALVSITVSDVSYNITTKSIGLMISEQAQQATTLDLVSLIMQAHARGERVRNVEEHINGIVSGDADRNMTALPTFTAQSIDASITQAGELTHVGWLKYLRQNYRKMSINRIICDLDTALAIEGRSGKPTRDTVIYPEGSNFPTNMNVDNLSISAPSVLIVDNGVVGANTIVGLDSRYAIRRVVNAQASYSAIENYVMRRATGFRIDYGEFSHRLYDDAFSVMTLTV